VLGRARLSLMALRTRTLRQIVTGRDSYILLFALLIIDYLSVSLIDSGRWGGLLHTLPVAASVLVGLHTSGARRRTERLTALVLLVALAASAAQAAVDRHQAGAVTSLILTILLAITALTILRRILQHRHVHLETLFGAVDVYILIGLLFASLFLGIADASANHHFGSFLAQPGPHPSSDYVYLSFITLTTVGFGDVTPHTELARSVVVLEALMGQIFLVTLVARLVALFGLPQPHLIGMSPEPETPGEITHDPFEHNDPSETEP
jgi:hypothetical protein